VCKLHFLEKICNIISHRWTPLIFSIISIAAIILSIIGILLNIALLNDIILGFSCILLLFSILIIIYQSFRIEIFVHPLILNYKEVETPERYYGVSNESDTEESTVNFYLSKHSLVKIKLKSVKFSYPLEGRLSLVSTTFVSQLAYIFPTTGIIESGSELLLNKEDFGLGAFVCYYRIYDTRFFKKSGDYLTIRIYYYIQILGLNIPVFNEKTVRLGYHLE